MTKNSMILMNDFKAEPVEVRVAEVDAVRMVLDSGHFILGPHVEAFEKNWASACGVEFGIGVANGMDAIEIILRSVNIGEGDEVITTPMTAFATALAILRAGAMPVLADINPGTGLMDIESVRRCIGKKTKAILLVHLYGQIKGMDEWISLSKLHNLILIEDCAQSHLAKYKGHPAGSFGVAGAYSFYPTKNLGCIGDGGMIVTNSYSISESAKMLRNYGQSVRYEHPIVGLNSRLDEIQAAILNVRLSILDKYTSQRKLIAKEYMGSISNQYIEMLDSPDDVDSHVYHLFVIKTKERNRLQEHLLARGVQSLIHYPIPIHKQGAIPSVKRDPLGLIESEEFAKSCISLPCHPNLQKSDVEAVIAAVNAFAG